MSEVILWGLGLVIALLAWALQLLLSVDKKVDRIETWKDGHDKQDDNRHVENLEKFEQLFRHIRGWKTRD